MKKIMHPMVDLATFFLDVYARMSSPLLQNPSVCPCGHWQAQQCIQAPLRHRGAVVWLDESQGRFFSFSSFFFFFFFFLAGTGGGGGRVPAPPPPPPLNPLLRTWHRRVICRACTRLCLAFAAVSIFLARVVYLCILLTGWLVQLTGRTTMSTNYQRMAGSCSHSSTLPRMGPSWHAQGSWFHFPSKNKHTHKTWGGGFSLCSCIWLFFSRTFKSQEDMPVDRVQMLAVGLLILPFIFIQLFLQVQ